VVIPAAAWGIAEVSPMASKYVPGLVLATLGAGSAASRKAAQLAKRADLPLVAGLFIRARYADHAKAWQPELVKAANLALVIALAAGISVNWSTIKSMFGSWVIVTVIVIIIVAGVLGVLAGLLPGGRSAEIRTTTGLVSVFRFGSLGLIIIGAQLHGNPDYLGPAITFALVDFILPLALAVEIGHRAGATAPTTAA
jgi:predicted Na+-dependent transporter